MKITTILAVFLSVSIYGQNKFELNLRSSWVYFTLNEDARETFGRNFKAFEGPNWVNEVSATIPIYNKNKINIELTSGYVLFWTLHGSTWQRGTNLETYIPVRIGINYNLLKWLKPSFEISNYVLTSRKRGEQFRYFPDIGTVVANSGIRSWYTNIDLGFEIKLNKKSNLTLSTPITIFPMFYVKDLGLLEPGSSLINMIAGNKGINVQYSYGF